MAAWLDYRACGVHVDGDHLAMLAAAMVILSQHIILDSTMVILSEHMHVRVDGLQLNLASISLIPTLHILSRTKAILTYASNFDGCQAFLLVSTVSMDGLSSLNKNRLTIGPLKGSHVHSQGRHSARASDGAALQGGEVHEVRKVGVAGDGLGGQVDLQGSLLFKKKHLGLESFIS